MRPDWLVDHCLGLVIYYCVTNSLQLSGFKLQQTLVIRPGFCGAGIQERLSRWFCLRASGVVAVKVAEDVLPGLTRMVGKVALIVGRRHSAFLHGPLLTI